MTTIIERTILATLALATALATATTLRTTVEDMMRPGLETIRIIVDAGR
jgi:hypothetical protein